MKILTDNPTTLDRFGFSDYAFFLAEIIKNTHDLPFTMGIFGDWGSGKTSLMKMIDQFIDADECNIKKTWFIPWKYDNKEDLWHAMIQSILNSMLDDVGVQNEELKGRIYDLARSFAWGAIKQTITTVTNGVITKKRLEKFKEAIIDQDEKYIRHINRFENDFAEIVNEYTAENGKLVIFIDDLDRCSPENAITVLEAIKLFIGNARCIFILGMDKQVVEQGIKLKYGDKLKLSGKDYLDKIIQVPFFLPKAPFNRMRESFSDAMDENAMNDMVWVVIKLGLKSNPRKTKRFINSFGLVKMMISTNHNAEDRESDFSLNQETNIDFILAQLLVLQLVFIQFYQYLQLAPQTYNEIVELIQYENNGNLARDLIDKRVHLEEFYKNKELMAFMTGLVSDFGHIMEVINPSILTDLINRVDLFASESSMK